MMKKLAYLALVAMAATACEASVSIGGFDYDSLESQISDTLDSQYESLGVTVDDVTCPRPDDDPEEGDTFLCTATIDDQAVRVEVTMESDGAAFNTTDLLYNVDLIAADMEPQFSEQFGEQTTVTCDGPTIRSFPESGGTFECTATTASGSSTRVIVTTDSEGGYSAETVE